MIPIIPENRLTNLMMTRQIDCVIIPFTECNLNCLFCDCPQPRIKKTPTCYDDCYRRLTHLLKDLPKNYDIVLQLQGGELFQDKFDLSDLETFLYKLEYIPNVQPINITTNLCHKSIDRTISLIKRHNVELSVSYDFIGRFNKKFHSQLVTQNIKKLFQANIKFNLNVVAHKPNIQYIKMHPTCLDIFYNMCTIGFEKYTDIGISQYMPSQEDIHWLINEYCSVHPKALYDLYFDRKCKICSFYELEITPNYTQWQCCDKMYNMIQFINKNNCLSCDQLLKCVKPCFDENQKCQIKK